MMMMMMMMMEFFMHFNDPYQPRHIINNLFILIFSFFFTSTWLLGSSVFIYLLFIYFSKGVKFRQIEENSREYSVVIFLFLSLITAKFSERVFFFCEFGKVISTLDSDFNCYHFFKHFLNLFRQVPEKMLTFNVKLLLGC
jgi:hypothetical protein